MTTSTACHFFQTMPVFRRKLSPSALWAVFSHWLYFNNTSNELCNLSMEDELSKSLHHIVHFAYPSCSVSVERRSALEDTSR